MKFEEALPALRAGKKIKRKTWPFYKHCYVKDNHIVNQNGELYIFGAEADILQDDWEIVKKKKIIKLRDLTEEQYKTFVDNKCGNQIVGLGCVDYPFYHVSCLYGKDNKCWIDNKDLYSDKFLDQKVEIEE